MEQGGGRQLNTQILSRLAMYLSVKTRMASSMLSIKEAARFSVLKECNGPFLPYTSARLALRVAQTHY